MNSFRKALVLLSLSTVGAAAPFAQGTWSVYSIGDDVDRVAVRDDTVWCATSGGVVRWDTRDMSYVRYTTNDGLKDNVVVDISVGPDGAVWAVTNGGISFYRNERWNDFPLSDSIDPANAYTIAFAGDGSLWIGGYDFIARHGDEGWTTFRTRDMAPYCSFIYSIAFSSDGAVWAGTNQGLCVYRNGSWVRVPGPVVKLATSINTVMVTPDGAVWCGSFAGVSRYLNGEWSHFDWDDGMKAGFVYELALDGFGGVYASGVRPDGIGGGLAGGGLYRYDGMEWKEIVAYGKDDVIHLLSIAIDSRDTLWIGASGAGLLRFAPDAGAGVAEMGARPSQPAISGNYPNPFNPSTTVSFFLSRSGNAELSVYSITGQKVRSLVSGFAPAGEYSVHWDGKDESGTPVSSGVYLARLRAGGMTSGHRMLLMK